MSEFGEGEYARLPADLLKELLQNAPEVAARVRALLEPALLQQGELRAAAHAADLIKTVDPATPLSLCAVDGGFAVERTIAVDIVMAVAVGVEGYASPGITPSWPENQYDSFHQVMLHNMDNERLARASMIIQELGTLADAPHDIRIYDGSHLTPVIQMNSGLSSRSEPVNQATVRFGRRRGIVESFEAFAANPQIIAMPKYDSSNQIAQMLSSRLKNNIPGDDKYVTGLVLSGGEYTAPQRVESNPWSALHLTAAVGTYAEKSGLVGELNNAIRPLVERNLFYTYWKPTDLSPSYRLEIKPDLADNHTALSAVFRSVERQMALPFVREPYPQYLADLMAKSVGLGLNALQAAAHLRLTRDIPELAPQLVHSYRTEGK